MPSRRRLLGIGELGIRLAAAFVGVAVMAVLTLILASSIIVTTGVETLVQDQQGDIAKATALAVAVAYGPGDWRQVDPSDLAQIDDLISKEGATLQVTTLSGRVIFTSPRYNGYPVRARFTNPIVEQGRRVGRLTVKFGPGGLGGSIAVFQMQRYRTWFIAFAIAAMLALGVSIVVARVITAPLEAMITTIRVRASGNRSARVEPVRGVGVLRELQENFNEAADQLDRLEVLRSNMVADVAHELRTPIAIVQAGHEAMLDGVAEPSAETLCSLRDEVLRLSRMVEDLQRLSAAESATLQLKLLPEDLAVIADDTAARMDDRFDAAGLCLNRRLTEAHVMCDKNKMREIITNLLTNAMKFTPAGGSVLLEVRPQDQHQVRLRVTDTGVGIPPDELPRVTERFFRGEGTAAMAAGSGIGLTIVDELVQAHGGELTITSEQQRGTQVTVTLPRLHPGHPDDRKPRARTVVVRATP